MLLTRWQPFSPFAWGDLRRFHDEMNHLFGRFDLEAQAGRPLAQAYPPLNVWEEGDRLHVEAELAGMELDNLEIYVSEGDQLTVKGERKPFAVDKGVWHRQERGFGPFSRTVTLPVPVDADKVEAVFEDGVLRVTLPRSEAARPRRIAVKGE